MRILIIGPSIERSKGGTATVIYEHLNNPTITGANEIDYVRSHVDGGKFEKAVVLTKAILHVVFKGRKYDLIHIHANSDVSLYRKILILWASKLFNKKHILHIHGHDFDSFYQNNTPFMKKVIKKSLAKTDNVLVLSPYWKRFFDKEFGDIKSQILHNGIDMASYAPCIRPTETFTNYLFMGRVGERKGAYDLIEAIDVIVNQKGRRDLKFFLAGDGDVEKVQAIVNQKKLDDNVKLLGWLSHQEKKVILRDCEVVLLPSYDENLPMALIEGMAAGKVVISTFAGGIPDLVVPGYNGYLFEAGDVNALINHILFVNQNPQIVKPMCQNNVDTIDKDFNLHTLSLKLNAIYDDLYPSPALALVK